MDVVTEMLYNQLNQKSIVMEIKSILIGSELEKVTLKCENLKQFSNKKTNILEVCLKSYSVI